MTRETFFGYVYRNGRYGRGEKLSGTQEVFTFIKEYLYAEEICVCDAGDNLIFEARDGIDLFSRLEEIGIDLPGIYQSLRREALGLDTDTHPRPKWEQLYDSIGLSPGEIAMRQRVKKAARAAVTVADVVKLLEETYFSASFYSEDETCCWSYFDPHDLTVRKMERAEDDYGTGWQDTGELVTINPDARVRHHSSGEDIHIFTLLDLPGSKKD